MTQTIARLFDRLPDAERAVDALESLGVPAEDISIVGHTSGQAPARLYGEHDSAGESVAKDAETGAAIGGTLGAAGGVLAGVALIVTPGLGPLVAAGWLAAAIGTAVAGAVAGAGAGVVVGLTTAGVHRDEAELMAEGVRRGGAIVSARVEDALFAQAEAALSEVGHVDLAARGAAYRGAGWVFDENAPPYSDEDIDRERARLAP
ncbi:MAG TPA: hypothetical protein VMU59_02955 [Caulobacteraceae bacterium]|nr:hypothetical protein [Caulobacteraceae bacterium]